MSHTNIAMWSGPRNLSTAMMYSFAQRSDCTVVDEPFYAAYLAATGLPHPMAEEIITAGQTNPAQVALECCNHSVSEGITYQKHITKHLLDDFPHDWLSAVTNVFLIRHPARVICSYHAKDENPVLSDIGVKEQVDILVQVRNQTGATPVVIDSADILANPAAMLKLLCERLEIPFEVAMLHWPKGPKPYDGVWASHWYQGVWNSEGFGAPPGTLPEVPKQLIPLLEQSMPYYDQLAALALQA